MGLKTKAIEARIKEESSKLSLISRTNNLRFTSTITQLENLFGVGLFERDYSRVTEGCEFFGPDLILSELPCLVFYVNGEFDLIVRRGESEILVDTLGDIGALLMRFDLEEKEME